MSRNVEVSSVTMDAVKILSELQSQARESVLDSFTTHLHVGETQFTLTAEPHHIGRVRVDVSLGFDGGFKDFHFYINKNRLSAEQRELADDIHKQFTTGLCDGIAGELVEFAEKSGVGKRIFELIASVKG
jgi:hypothetical protein